MMENLHAALQQKFGFGEFRPGQEAVIRAVLEGRDAVVVMPTGAGKSLCFQLPALMMEGTAIVVSPLIALMKDQVDALTARHIPATFLNSSLSSDEMSQRLVQMRRGHYKLVYLAPERFRNPRFLAMLQETPMSMLAIDEAHCMSQWGHDFRPDYLYLEQIIKTLSPHVRLLAVTATATDEIRQDIATHLCFGQGGRLPPEMIVTGFSRPNLHLTVTRVRTHGEKLERLLQVIECFHSGIVYCATRKMVERVQTLLAEHGICALAYNGAMEDEDRTRVQNAFMNRKDPIVIATNAFGMGVDRSDLRFVIHWDIPGSVEAYYQEVGRAGRDGAYAWCELLYNYADVRTQEFFIDAANPPMEQVYELYAAIRNACAQGEGGEASFSAEGWAERAGIKSALTVRNLVALFERRGLIFRERRLNSPDSILSVPATSDVVQLKQICAALATKDRADHERLRELLHYVDTSVCRHRFLLAYFGETAQVRTCSKCDHCHPLNSFPPRKALDENRFTELQKILSCIVRMHGVGDFATVVAVLRGKSSAFTTLTTYGILAEMDEQTLLRECEALEFDGYIIGMRLTGKGYDFVLGKGERVPVVDLRESLPQVRRGVADEPAHGVPLRVSEPRGLATVLRSWVREEAARRGLPAYRVLPSQTVAAIAKQRPTSFVELEIIPGLGEIKIAKYGQALLDLIAVHEK
ncbi:MAG: ATP-dependent DNA helicase RecQ [Kiritimatiellia bacterium]